jgi:hypothetical protein
MAKLVTVCSRRYTGGHHPNGASPVLPDGLRSSFQNKLTVQSMLCLNASVVPPADCFGGSHLSPQAQSICPDIVVPCRVLEVWPPVLEVGLHEVELLQDAPAPLHALFHGAHTDHGSQALNGKVIRPPAKQGCSMTGRFQSASLLAQGLESERP